MSNFSFLDFIWKCLLMLTVSSSGIFIFALLGQTLISNFISNEKSKKYFNYHILLIACSLIGGSIILYNIDPEIIAECFNNFAISSNSYTITRLLAGGYLIFFLSILALDCLRLFLLTRKHRAFNKVENHFINETLEKLKSDLKIKTSIDILLNEEATSPYVWGLLRYRIVVNPLLLTTGERQHITAILSHELMHIKGHDSAWLFLNHLVRRIFFFNPISYIYYKKHRVIVEMAADEKAIEQCGVEPKNLLKSILEIAESCTRCEENLLQVNASQEFSEIKLRIQAMMKKPKKILAWVYPTFSMISLILSLVITTLQTKASVGAFRSRSDSGEFMCTQIRHEKVIENWLRIDSPPNKCDMKQ